MQINTDLVVQRAGLIDVETEETLLYQIHAINEKSAHLYFLIGEIGIIL